MTDQRRREDLARDVWSMMADMVINHDRKREVAEATGISFAKTRALRRVAHRALSMGELATLLSMDPPNVTTLIDDLQAAGLVRRQPHPTDRRVWLVEATSVGRRIARQADDILERPPAGLRGLSAPDLEELRRILALVG